MKGVSQPTSHSIAQKPKYKKQRVQRPTDIQVFLNVKADVDDAIAEISAPPFDLPTTRGGTAGGFLRFGGGGGDRRWTFFVPVPVPPAVDVDVDVALPTLPAGLGGIIRPRGSKVRADAGTSGDGGGGGLLSAGALMDDIGDAGS